MDADRPAQPAGPRTRRILDHARQQMEAQIPDTAPALAVPAEPVPAPVAAPSRALTPMEMLSRAVESGADVETLSRLMDLQDRWQAQVARQNFNRAMAAAKRTIGPIVKSKAVSGSNGKVMFRHETLHDVLEAAVPALAAQGIDVRWRTANVPGGAVELTCVLVHEDGWEETNSLSAMPDTGQNRNAVQALGSAVTYLQRYTIKSALGIAASEDTDGRAPDAPPPAAPRTSAAQAKRDGDWELICAELAALDKSSALLRWALNSDWVAPPRWSEQVLDRWTGRAREVLGNADSVDALTRTRAKLSQMIEALPDGYAEAWGEEFARVASRLMDAGAAV